MQTGCGGELSHALPSKPQKRGWGGRSRIRGVSRTRCGPRWAACWPIRHAVSARRGGGVTRRVPVWRASCTCSARARPGCRCPIASSLCPAARPAGGGWRNGLERGLLLELIGHLQEQLSAAEALDWSRVLVDASLVEAKKGARVARTLLGRPGSRFHLAVDAQGSRWPCCWRPATRTSSATCCRCSTRCALRHATPGAVGRPRYASAALAQALHERGIQPRISQPRRLATPSRPAPPPARSGAQTRGSKHPTP